MKNVERIKDLVRFTSYGYKGFFDIVDIDEKTLEEILDIDIDMIRKINGFEEQVIEDVEMLNKFFNEFERTFIERKNKISGVR